MVITRLLCGTRSWRGTSKARTLTDLQMTSGAPVLLIQRAPSTLSAPATDVAFLMAQTTIRCGSLIPDSAHWRIMVDQLKRMRFCPAVVPSMREAMPWLLINSNALTTDQRGVGFSRIVNATVDIGAFESRGFSISTSSGTPQSATITTVFNLLLMATEVAPLVNQSTVGK